MKSIVESLEERAREIRERLRSGASQDETAPLGWLEVQITFWLEQLERRRDSHRQLVRELLVAECAVRTDLRQLTDPHHGDPSISSGPRMTLTSRLLGIDRDRRQAAVFYAKEVGAIHERLLQLLVQHAQLSGSARFNHEHKSPSQQT